MPHKASINIVVLWEHEIIAAAKALLKAAQKDATGEDVDNAFKACFAALAAKDLANADAHVTVMKAVR